MEALKLTGREKQIYVEAERAIGGTGLPLHSVAHGFAGAYDDILGGPHIVEAARYYSWFGPRRETPGVVEQGIP